MMDDNRFFKFVWRFNSIVIGLAALGALLGMTLIIGAEVSRKLRPRQVTNVVNVDTQAEIKVDLRLGTPQSITGGVLRIPLNIDQSYDVGVLSKGSRNNAVNYLFVDTGSGESSWLVEGADHLISSLYQFNNKMTSYPSSDDTVTGVMYEVIDKDTNGDKRLTVGDHRVLATSDIDGKNYRVLIDDADNILSVEQISKERVAVLFEIGKESYVELYEIAGMKKLSRIALPKINQKK